jgi:hypothetical protein
MGGPSLPKQWLCIASAIALVVAVVVSPVRPVPGAAAVPNYLRRNFATPSNHTSGHPAKSVVSGQVRVKAIASKAEEKRPGPNGLVRTSVDITPQLPTKPPRGLAAFGSPRATHPLRC